MHQHAWWLVLVKGAFDDVTPTSDEGGECNDTVTILP